MASGSVFPAIIRAEYQGGNAFPAFANDIDQATQRAQQKFDQSFGQISRTIQSALNRGTTSAGALDLGVKEANEAAAAALRRADALREVARAARSVADVERNVPALNVQARAAAAAAVEARNLSREAAQQALALDRLQVELDQAAASTKRFAGAQAGSIAMSGAGRQAYVGVGQQIADVAIQAQMGTNAFVILGQQGSQLAFQLSNAGGVAGRVATFFAGPWGAAVLGAASIAGLLATKLGDTADAAEDVRFATNAVSDAQGILGSVMDIATGKINTQSAALIALAKAQVLVARVQAQTRAAEARKGVVDIQYRETQISGGMGGGFSMRRRPVDARDTISREVLAGTLDSKTAIERLENLRRVGQITDEAFASAASSVANLGVELENAKVFAEAEKLLDGTGGRGLLKPKKEKSSRERKGPSAETLANRREALAEFGRDASDKISGIQDRFGDAPTMLQRQAAALRELNDIQTDLEKRKPPELDKLLAQLSEARGLVESSLSKPFRDMLETAREQAEIDDLLIDGREIEAEILQRTLALKKQGAAVTADQVEKIAEVVQQERLRAIELDRQRRLQQRQLALLDQTQDNLRATVKEVFEGKGFGAIGNLFARQFDIYVEGLTDQISESLFGDVFREEKLKLLGLDKVDEAGKTMAASVTKTANDLDRLREAARGAATALGAAAANDNPVGSVVPSEGDEIVVTARRTTSQILRDAMKSVLSKAFGDKFAAGLAENLGKAMQGAAIGQATSGFARSVGLKQSKLGSQIGGALGNFIPGLPPGVVSAIGGLIGGTIGGLFKKTPKGSATISSLTGDIGYSGSGSLRNSVSGLGNNVKSSLSNIIEQLGGTAGQFSVSIGQRGKNFVVDPTGRGRTKGSGVQKFKTEEEAARAALMDAIMDGAVAGIKAGAQRLLQSGKDLDAQLQKAIKFQSVFDRLEAIKNPMSAAVNALGREFTGLIGIFREAGASAEEFAQLEELYGLERAKIIEEQSEALTGSLRSLIDDLTKGDSGLALRDRLANIRADFDPLAGKIRAGETVDYDKFSELARQLIDVQRQISGSQVDYFQVFNEVLGLSQQALAGQQNVISIGSGSTSPFSGSAPPSNASTPVVSAIDRMNGDLGSILHAINTNIGALANSGSAMIAPSQTRLAMGGAVYW